MKLSSLITIVVALTLFVSLLSVWFYPSMQDFMTSNQIWNGTKNFSKDFNARDVDSLSELPESVNKTTLVLIPQIKPSDEDKNQIKRFIDDGGTLLLMDDYGYGNDILAYLGLPVRFSNKPLLDPVFYFKNQWLPQITDLRPDIKESGARVVVLNHATGLTDVEESQVFARSSGNSFLDLNENEELDDDEPQGPFPVAAQFRIGQGTLSIFSDPSIIINSMLHRDDNYTFVRFMTANGGREQEEIIVDNAHLTKAPLDLTKTRLREARKLSSNPYVMVGIVAVIFLLVSRYILKKGEAIG